MNRFGESLSSMESSGKKRSEHHSHGRHSRKEIADDVFKGGHESRMKEDHEPRDERFQGVTPRILQYTEDILIVDISDESKKHPPEPNMEQRIVPHAHRLGRTKSEIQRDNLEIEK